MAIGVKINKVPGGDLSRGVPIELTPEQRGEVVMTKYVSMNEQHADWQPSGEWFEQVTSDVGLGRDARIVVKGVDGEDRAVSIDDGLIIDLVGKMSGVVGMSPEGQPMSEEQARNYRDATGRALPMFQKWDFRISRILKTNGPEARHSLLRSEDQKRQAAQTEMFETFIQMFKAGMETLRAQGANSPSPSEVLKAGANALGGSKK